MWWTWTILACRPGAQEAPAVSVPVAVEGDAAARSLVVAWETYRRGREEGRLLDLLGAAATRVREDPLADPPARDLLLTWVLDADLRRATEDRRALEDLVRSVGPELSDAELSPAIARVAGRPLTAWEAQRQGSSRLDLGAALQWFGLAFRDTSEARLLDADPGASPIARQRCERWLLDR